MTLFIQFLFKESGSPIQPPKPEVAHEPSPQVIVSAEPTNLPKVDIAPPPLTPEELKIKALNQILGRRN
jgi:hypothetical protein